MTPDRWERINQLYHAALEVEEEQKGCFLEQACGADHQLRQEVESLLVMHQQGNGFLERPAIEEVARTLKEEPLSLVGRQVGSYQIVSLLGVGGMGEVYLARDTKLGRQVALKVLPEALAHEPERLARFRREARMLAVLNHPNIAAIYGLEESDDVHYLVLELVPGETLAERLAAGPLGIEEALRICGRIAEALEAAHEKGVIHRDLKPANIKVTPEGKVKVLDFGLAKAFSGEPFGGGVEQSLVTEAGTGEAVILGTAAYMSPEQARGKSLDKRTDIWSFGCVLYECLTARMTFPAETVSDTIAAILQHDPDWSLLPEATPAKIRDLLRRCLQKNPHQRLHDIADARIEIEEALAEPLLSKAELNVPARHQGWWWVPWSLAGLLAVSAAAAIWAPWRSSQPSQRPLSRFAINLPQNQSLMIMEASVELSPDGTKLLYVAGQGDSRQIYLRPIDKLEAVPIPGTEEAASPFFSPDGQWIAYQSDAISRDGMLTKISLLGGPPQVLCDVKKVSAFGAYWGGCWGPDGTIFFSGNSGLMRVSANGRTPEAVTRFPNREGYDKYPQVLPGGQAVLVTDGRFGRHRIAVRFLKTGELQTLIDPGEHARYLSTGHLVYGWGGDLLAAPFDLEQLRVTGPSVRVLEGVMRGPGGKVHFSVSENGSLVYLSGGDRQSGRRLVWVGRQGRVEPLPFPPGNYRSAQLSEDGKQLLVSESRRLKIYNLERGTLGRLTEGEGDEDFAFWTPDGKQVVFNSNRHGGPLSMNLYTKSMDGSGQENQLAKSEYDQVAESCSAQSKVLLFTEWFHPATGFDLWMLPLEGDRTPRPYLQTRFNEFHPMFSPDGRWLAYVSDQSGRNEVYVRPYPGPGGTTQISTEGGTEPLWSPDGRELFYRVYRNLYNSYFDYGSQNGVMAVSLTTEPTLRVGRPQLLFEGPYTTAVWYGQLYDLAPDGRRFLMVKQSDPPPAPTQINVVLNWFDELQRLVPSGNH